MRTSTVSPKGRNVLFTLLGVAGLVLVAHYSGPHQDIVHSYGGNLAASFAAYFVVSNLPFAASKYRRLLVSGTALLAVELFEVTNGFGVMTNVYDPVDLVANACGVASGLALDSFTPGGQLPHDRGPSRAPEDR